MKKFALAATVVAASVLGLASSAFAVSCSQQGGQCRGWASGQGAQAANFVALCNTEVKSCIARCKTGEKYFLGVSSSPQQYPIKDCR